MTTEGGGPTADGAAERRSRENRGGEGGGGRRSHSLADALSLSLSGFLRTSLFSSRGEEKIDEKYFPYTR